MGKVFGGGLNYGWVININLFYCFSNGDFWFSNGLFKGIKVNYDQI